MSDSVAKSPRSLEDFAVAYARKGWPVFPTHEAVPHANERDAACSCGKPEATPANVEAFGKDVCKSPGKHPRTRNGLTDATTNEVKIRAWWARWPNAPIAIATGGENGPFLLDIDTKPPKRESKDPEGMRLLTGIEGLEILRGLVEFPETPQVESGSGGVHFYFEMPKGRKYGNVYGARLPDGSRAGIDVRATGGYVIVPPSPHASGMPYRWTTPRGVGLAPVPEALLEILYPAAPAVAAPATPATPWSRPASGEDEAEQRSYALGALKKACERIRAGGGVNHVSRHAAVRNESVTIGGYVPHLIDEDFARAELMEAGLSHADKSPRDIRRLVDSGLTLGASKPRWPPPSRKALERAAAAARPAWSREQQEPPEYGEEPPHPADEPEQRAAQAPPDDEQPPDDEPPAREEPAREEPPTPAVDPRAALAGAALLKLRQVVAACKAAQDKAAMQVAFGALLDAAIIDGLAEAQVHDEFAAEGMLNELVSLGLRGDVVTIRKAIGRRGAAIREAALEAKADKDDSRFRTTDDLVKSLGRLASSLPPMPRAQVPNGFEVNEQGTWVVTVRDDGVKRKQIIQRPIFLASVSVDVDTGDESVVVRWWDGRCWRSRLVGRNVIGVARRLAEESGKGLPVSSQSSNDLVSYFEAYMAENEQRLPRLRTSTVQGWTEGGFLIGPDLIGKDGPVPNPTISMAVDDPGLKEILGGYRSSGTWDGWVASIERVRAHPRVMLALLAGLSPPLIKIIKAAPNFIVDFAGTTSHGKTTAMRVAASSWGYPHDRDGGIIRPWNSSPTFIDRLCALSCDLPVLLDDTKAVKNKSQIGNVIYMIAQGQGKGRGTVHGVQATGTWRTVALSTGESPATEYSQEGGAAVRCLTLWGSPMEGGQSDTNRELAEALEMELLEHHGHAGRRLVAWLQHEENAAWVREQYVAIRGKWGAYANGNAVVGRASAYLALLEVTQEACRAIGIPTCTEDVFAGAWQAVLDAANRADKATLALRAAYEYAISAQGQFYGRHNVQIVGWDRDLTPAENIEKRTKQAESYTPAGGWRGGWQSAERWVQIAFLRDKLDAHLRELGYDPGAVTRSWDERGWLDTKPGEGLLKSAKVGKGSARCYCVRREAFAAIAEVASLEVQTKLEMPPPSAAPDEGGIIY